MFIKLNSKLIKLKFDRRARWGCACGNALCKPRGAALPGHGRRAGAEAALRGRGHVPGPRPRAGAGATCWGRGRAPGRPRPCRGGWAEPQGSRGPRRRGSRGRATGEGRGTPSWEQGRAARMSRGRAVGEAGARRRGPRPRRGARAGGNGGRAGKKKGEGEEKIERERERERGGDLTSGSKSGDHRLQNLGHHGGRERGGEEVAVRENQMKERERKEGARAWGRGSAPGACGPERAGLGRTAGQNPAARTTTVRILIREMKTKTRLGKHAIKHDIRQKKYDSA
jgi:hypothetical protein